MLKVKLLAALAAISSFECVGPFMPTRPEGETSTSRQSLTVPPLPPTPAIQPVRAWERGMKTGLVTSGAQSAYLVLQRDPANTARVLAYGFDPTTETNLFVFAFPLVDAVPFQQNWVVEVDGWRASGSSSIKTDSITDGIGTTPPAPRPGLADLLGWKHAYYAWQMQKQIDAETH